MFQYHSAELVLSKLDQFTCNLQDIGYLEHCPDKDLSQYHYMLWHHTFMSSIALKAMVQISSRLSLTSAHRLPCSSLVLSKTLDARSYTSTGTHSPCSFSRISPDFPTNAPRMGRGAMQVHCNPPEPALPKHLTVPSMQIDR